MQIGRRLKKSFLISMILVCKSSVTIAYAGSLNPYEQEVISAAEGTFDYAGSAYKLDSSYKSQLKDYLISDGIDLTKEQRDTIMSSINDYIETGVKEGYLVPVSAAATTAPNVDSNPTEGHAPNTSLGESNDTGNVTEKASREQATGISDSNTFENLQESVMEDRNSKDIAKKDSVSMNVEDENIKAVDPSMESNLDKKESTVIKSRNFEFTPTIIVAALMGVLVGILISVAVMSVTRFLQSRAEYR